MGIKNINPLIKRFAANANFVMPIERLSGKRIAIDGNNWMYTNMAIARKKVINKTDVTAGEPDPLIIRKEWFLAGINFIVSWMSYNITPVFIFDGQNVCREKDDTKAKRRDSRIAARAKIDALYEKLNADILERPANIIEELRKELRNYNFIAGEDFELFKMVIKGIGIPCLDAYGDGEQLCSALCIEGKVAAVFSVDTDNLVYGCPLIINGFSSVYAYDEYGHRVPQLDCVRIDTILEGMKISHSVFVDLCIMSGCDFNTNMPNHGAIKSFNLLQKYGSIDNLPREYDITCLNHHRCREIFAYKTSESLIVDNSINTSTDSLPEDQDKLALNRFDINKQAITTSRDYLEMAGISGQINRIVLGYQTITPASDGYVESLNLVNVLNCGVPVLPKLKFLTLNVISV